MNNPSTLEDFLLRFGWKGEKPLFKHTFASLEAFNAIPDHDELTRALQKPDITLYYPGAGKDRNILQFLQERGREPGDGLNLVVQDANYLKPDDFILMPDEEAAKFARNLQTYQDEMRDSGVTVLDGLVSGEEIPDGADVIYLQALWTHLIENNMGPNILKNSRQGTLIRAPDYDAGLLSMLFDGVDLLSPTLAIGKDTPQTTTFYDFGSAFYWTTYYTLGELVWDDFDRTRYMEDFIDGSPHNQVLQELCKNDPSDVAKLEAFLGNFKADYISDTFEEAYDLLDG